MAAFGEQLRHLFVVAGFGHEIVNHNHVSLRSIQRGKQIVRKAFHKA